MAVTMVDEKAAMMADQTAGERADLLDLLVMSKADP